MLFQGQALIAPHPHEPAAGPMWKNCGKGLVNWGLVLGPAVLIDRSTSTAAGSS